MQVLLERLALELVAISLSLAFVRFLTWLGGRTGPSATPEGASAG